ncbi:aspartyl protease family protein [Novosphingobium sp. BL-8H]|uniref:aspartyl protease family protein n=1 Tax=Novosphingobium sp. BL-8H TaxID=3127640 RepID=UPI00375676AA
MIGGALALMLVAATPAASGTAPVTVPDESDPAGQTLKTGTDADERMTVAVAVQGQGPYHFLIDTGSQQTVVSSTLAGTLGLPLGPEVTVIGMAGSSSVSTARVGTLAIGQRSFRDLTVPLLEAQHIGADGIVGTDSLQGQRVTLDFERSTIAISPVEEVSDNKGYEIVVRAHRRLGRLIMTDAVVDGIRANVVIDTGASSAVGNLALQNAMRKHLAGTVKLASVTGDVLSAELAIAQKLKIGELGVTNIVIAFADSPAFRELGLEKRPALFLGMRELRIFRRIAIDFSSRKVLFDIPRNSKQPVSPIRKIASSEPRTK